MIDQKSTKKNLQSPEMPTKNLVLAIVSSVLAELHLHLLRNLILSVCVACWPVFVYLSDYSFFWLQSLLNNFKQGEREKSINYLVELPFAATFEITWFSDSLSDLMRTPYVSTWAPASVLILHTTTKETFKKLVNGIRGETTRLIGLSPLTRR